MPQGKQKPGATARATARGMVAAMAMTGVRTVAAGIAPQEKTPPQAIVEKHAPKRIQRWQTHHRQAVTELLHWAYGAAGGAAFGLLPDRVRRLPATGPAYGLAIWLGFELAVAPALGVRHARERRVLWRMVVALDHVLYGLVVAGRFAPEPDAARRQAEE
ncbi:hypothetical protein [Streptomyces sp. S.PNR 29]|uniref:hypothetical protein n=1 Tax=Streptomyces sp. S.PNR 29 TaxID=2973805 RepID=UPI0025B0F97E|nr:hypothetical protein [Streptomyces sp. S.PNR 29]MDN0196535.1 hypothetical protein [Streptomyces sp. S.PNR 29]